jgi:hypothetical protein
LRNRWATKKWNDFRTKKLSKLLYNCRELGGKGTGKWIQRKHKRLLVYKYVHQWPFFTFGGESFLEIDEFSQWLFTEGKAAKTIESYVNDVKGFQSYLKDKLKDVPVLSRLSFVRYKEHLMKEGYAVSTKQKD